MRATLPLRSMGIMMRLERTGIADLLVRAFEAEGLTTKEAYERLWFVDGTGLVVSSRKDLAEHKVPYAHDVEFTISVKSELVMVVFF